MASLHYIKQRDAYTLQFNSRESRKTVHLGRIPKPVAEKVRDRIEELITAQKFGMALEDGTLTWLAKIGDRLFDSLARAGLVSKRKQSTVKQFVDTMLADRSDVKAGTVTSARTSINRLIEFLGPDRMLDQVTEEDGPRWVKWMLTDQKLAKPTVGRGVRHVKSCLAQAVNAGFIKTNPFEKLAGFPQTNSSRLQFIDKATIARIIDACPDPEFRLILALARYGGLRTPSEHLALRWGDVLWHQNKIWINSPKTAHHENKDKRLVPIFPELRPFLEHAFASAEDGQVYVINGRRRSSSKNWRPCFERLLEREGVKKWPRLWQNLRASRETELCAQFPLHVVCQWIGNTAALAAKHYLQVRESDFVAAAGQPTAAIAEAAAVAS